MRRRYQVCPICNQNIPVNEMQEHMRIELLDPKYMEQRKHLEARASSTNIAADDEIFKYCTFFCVLL